MRQVDGVEDALVVLSGGGSLGSPAFLVGYAVAESVDDTRLREACEGMLPSYMVPSAFVLLEAWPLNANGKIDRKALPEPSAAQGTEEYVAPRTAAERTVADAVGEVLLGAAVSVTADLMRLGVTSLMAVRLSSVLSKRREVVVTTQAVLQHRTIAAIAACAGGDGGGDTGMPALLRVERDSTSDAGLPLSREQEQMWVLYQMDRASAAYNVPDVVRVRGELRVDALKGAVEAAAGRHEALRMQYFTAEDGSTSQRPVPAEQWQL